MRCGSTARLRRLASSLTALERSKRDTEARLEDASQRASCAAPVAIERRRGELMDALENGVSAGELNVRLRGVFEAAIPDHRTGRITLRWVGGQTRDREILFAMPG